MKTGFLLIITALCYGDSVLGDLLFDSMGPEGPFITIPGLEDALPVPSTVTKLQGTESGSAPFDFFGRESDYLHFVDLPSSVELRDPDKEEVRADSRKLLLADEMKEDEPFREFFEEVEGDASLRWRLKDLSLLQRLQGRDLQAREGASVKPPGRRGQPLLQKRRSKEGVLCEHRADCEAGGMRRKLQLDLSAAHSSPLSTLIDYRLKFKPSLSVSKKANGLHDLGIPDIYEREVDVTPLSRSPSKIVRRHRDPTFVSAHQHKKFLPKSSSPKFVSLGSLYNHEETKPNHKTSMSEAPVILQRGKGGIQLNPQAGGIRRHLPFRRPVAFKYTRGTGDRAPENVTKALSPLEKITLNKTPGIVLEYPNVAPQVGFGGFSPLPSDSILGDHAFMRLRPAPRGRKKKKQTVKQTQDQKDSHLVPKQFKGHGKHQTINEKQEKLPNRSQVSPQKNSGTSTKKSSSLHSKTSRTPSGSPNSYTDSKFQRVKGQVPKWLITLQKERVTQAPPAAYFPEASTVKWIPIKSRAEITSGLGHRSNKSPLPRGHHRTNPGKQVIPREDKDINEYLPPDSSHPVKVIQTTTTPYSNQSTKYSPLPYMPSHSNPTFNFSGPAYSPRFPNVIYSLDDDYNSSPDDFYDLSDDEYYYDDDSYVEEEYDDEYYDYDYDVLELVTGDRVPFMPHIIMADLDDILHDLDILEYGYILGIPGIAGRDYPILQFIPLTNFRCHLVADYPGYYADMEAGCQVFHVCHRNGRQDSFLCPNGTIFNQKYFVCDWWYNFACEDAAFFYPVNAAIEYQEVALHEGHLLGGYSFSGISTTRSKSRKTTDGKRTRRRSSLRSRKSKDRRARRRPHRRQPPSHKVLGFRG